MKIKPYIIAIICIIVMCITLVGCTQNQPSEIATEQITIKNEGTVVILATGGTIAGSGEAGKETGYTSGSLSVESLIEAVPGIEDVTVSDTDSV